MGVMGYDQKFQNSSPTEHAPNTIRHTSVAQIQSIIAISFAFLFRLWLNEAVKTFYLKCSITRFTNNFGININ